MMRLMLMGVVLAFFTCISAQQSSWKYSDYENVSHKDFRKKSIFKQQINIDKVDYPLLHAAIFYVTNEVRTKKGLDPFDFSLNLEISAWHHSKAMAENDFFNHSNLKVAKRRTPNDRAKLAGISNPFLAENIAETSALQYKSGTPVVIVDKNEGIFSYEDGGPVIESETYLGVAETVVEQWMNSKPHRKNILSPEGLELGVGAYLYRDKRFYNMPTFKMTQNFQWYEPVTPMDPLDKLPN